MIKYAWKSQNKFLSLILNFILVRNTNLSNSAHYIMFFLFFIIRSIVYTGSEYWWSAIQIFITKTLLTIIDENSFTIIFNL